MSPIFVPEGATPFITNKPRPNGGVVTAISILSSIIAPNHTGSKPSALVIGINTGRVTIMMDTGSRNIPRSSNKHCMPAKIPKGCQFNPPTNETKPRVAPV